MSIPNFEDVPGYDALMAMASEALEPEVITRMPPMDLSYIKDSGARAVVALAISAKWNVVRKPTRPLTLVSRDGVKLQLASDTSLRFSVFSQRINAIGRHSQTVTLTDSLIEEIIKVTKVDHSHARVLRGLPRMKMPPPDELPTPEQIVETFAEPPSAIALEDDPTILRVEPTMVMGGPGLGYISPLMETVIRQLVDGDSEQITYRCVVCGLEFPSRRGVGAHWQVHVKAGEAKATNNMKREWIKVDAPEPVLVETEPDDQDWVVEVGDTFDEPEPEPPSAIALAPVETDITVEVVAGMVRSLIDQATQQIAAERDQALAEVVRLRNSLSTLYDLLGELNQPTKESK